MPARGYGRAVVLGWVALMATPASALADELVLVAPVQGSAALRSEFGDHVPDAVRRALEARGYSVAASRAPMGQAVVACQTPECVEQALDAAEAAFAIVPAVWSRSSGGPELTLTLVQRSGHNLNATGPLGEDLSSAAAASEAAAGSSVIELSVTASPPEHAHPHAWKAGPIILISGGAAAFLAIGVAAGIKNDTQQLNTGAVAAWASVGAAAFAGGLAWWVIGEKRRRSTAKPTIALPLLVAFQGSKIDLRLRF